MKVLRSITLGAALVLVAVAVAPQAQAACGNAFVIPSSGHVGIDGTGPYLYSDIPGITPDLTGIFWALGGGNPIIGSGDDNGSWGRSNWTSAGPGPVYFGPQWYNYYYGLITNWAASSAIDGCVLNQGPSGDNCTCVLLTDQVDGVGYWMVASDQSNSAGDFDFSPWTGGGWPLFPVPKINITNTQRNGTRVDATVSLASQDGIFLDPACDCAPTAFQILLGLEDPGVVPVDRDIANWTVVGETAVGTSTTVNIDCSAINKDAYLVGALVLPDGWVTNFVSENSVKIACDPNLADPADINEVPRDVRTIRQQPSRERSR